LHSAETALQGINERPIFASETLPARRDLARERLFGFARVLLLGTLFAAPLAFGAVQPWAWGAIGVAAAILLVLWAWGETAGSREQGTAFKIRVYWSPIYLPAAAFLVLAVVQYFSGLTLDPAATKEALARLVTDLVLFFLAGQFLAQATEPQWRKMGLALTLYTFAIAVFATLQFSSSHNLIYWAIPSPGYTFGPYVNHNHYAGLMEILIPLAVASALPAIRKHPSAVLLGFAALIPIASLLLSGSRGGFISLVVEVLLAAILIFLCGPQRVRKAAAAVGGLGIIAAVVLFFWMAPRQIAERLATMADATHSPEVALADRLAPAKDSLRIFRAHPWVGAGLGSFETVFPQYQSFPSDLTWDHAHNDYAEALAETGIVGGALVLFSLGLFFWLAFRNLRERLWHREGWLQIGAAIGCCGLLVHSFVDFNLHIPGNAAWFAVCAAIATCVPKGTMRGTSL
jgi:O-antigen ligase